MYAYLLSLYTIYVLLCKVVSVLRNGVDAYIMVFMAECSLARISEIRIQRQLFCKPILYTLVLFTFFQQGFVPGMIYLVADLPLTAPLDDWMNALVRFTTTGLHS